jgi:hypothetical protein
MLEVIALAKGVDVLTGLLRAIVSNIYLYFEAVKDAPKRSEELRLELACVCGLLESLHTALCASKKSSHFVIPSHSLESSIAQFEVIVNEISARVSEAKTQGVERLKWPFTKYENERFLSRLERYKASFNMALSIKCLYLSFRLFFRDT